MQLAIYIHDPEQFLKGDYEYAMAVVPKEHWDWWDSIETTGTNVLVSVVEVDSESVNRDELTRKAIAGFDKRQDEIRGKAEAEVTELERRKAELLAIPFIQGDPK